MKHYLGFLVRSCLAGLLFSSCGKQETKLPEGGTLMENGLKPSEIALMLDGEDAKSKRFTYGQQIRVECRNVSGFKVSSGIVNAQMDIYMLKGEKDTIISWKDILEDSKYKVGAKPIKLHADLILANPIFSARDYTLVVHVRDLASTASFIYEQELEVHSNPQLNVKARKLTFDEAYIYAIDREQVLYGKRYQPGESLMFGLDGLKGLSENYGIVNASLSIRITDDKGTVLLDEPNLFKAYAKTGFLAEEFNERVYFTIATPEKETKRIQVHAVLLDMNSDAAVILDAELFAATE